MKRNKKNIKISPVDFNKQFIIFGDKNKLEQVISNLVHNSIKSITRKYHGMDEGNVLIKLGEKKSSSTIKSNTNPENDIVNIVIEDDGEGIDLTILPKLFTKFTAKSSDGNGLGLYISKKIIEAHGGKIWAQNKKDRKGAKVTFSLPLFKNISN